MLFLSRNMREEATITNTQKCFIHYERKRELSKVFDFQNRLSQFLIAL